MDDPALDAYVTLRGLRFHYREYPPPQADQPQAEGPARALVLLHGLASNARWWLLVAPLLAQRFHVLALNQRGHGESDKPDDGYDFPTVAGDLAAFVEARGLERPIIVGHSWGSDVALEYAATFPEQPAGIVLTEGGFMEVSAQPGATWERTKEMMAPPDLTQMTPEELVKRAKQWALGSIWSEEIETALLGNFRVAEDGGIRPHLSRANHMQVVRAYWEHHPLALCDSVRCPTLVIAAERQAEGQAGEWLEMKREAITRLESRLSDCQVRWFPDSIHDVPLQRPKEMAQVIQEFALKLNG